LNYLIFLPTASQVTSHRSSFLQLENASSAEFQVTRYHSTGYQATACHASEYHATECNATCCQGTERYAAKYQQSTGCHATGYHPSGSENRIAQRLGGLTYDHGEFPKIISVHSMAKGSNTMQPAEYSDHSATNGETNPSPCHEICDDTDRHGNSDDKQSTCSSMENNLAERKLECESTADNKPSDHSISTILSSSGQTVFQSSPIQDDGRLKSFTGVFSRPPDESDRSDAENSKVRTRDKVGQY